MEAVFLIGIQGSGKSHFYRQKFFRTHVRLSLDLLKTRNRLDRLLQACLETKQRLVIDNTNPTVEERARYIQRAQSCGFKITGYFFEPDIGAALKRNESRPEAERIPKPGIFTTLKRLQRPSCGEGFDELYCVRIDERTNEFIVKKAIKAGTCTAGSERL